MVNQDAFYVRIRGQNFLVQQSRATSEVRVGVVRANFVADTLPTAPMGAVHGVFKASVHAFVLLALRFYQVLHGQQLYPARLPFLFRSRSEG